MDKLGYGTTIYVRRFLSSTVVTPTATVLVFVSALLPAVQPLISGHLPWRADGLLHLYRLAQLERALQHGLFYPRWLPDLGFGFGFPLFNYYAPFSYYLLLPLRGLGFSLETALQVGYMGALVTLAAGAYLWARDLFGQAAGLVAAFAVSYAPYVLYDVHHRGVLPEIWGLAWLSLAFWALHRLAIRIDRSSLILSVLCYAALLLTHNILALVATPLLLAYGLFLAWLGRQEPPGKTVQDQAPGRSSWRRALAAYLDLSVLAPIVIATSLALGLTTFFWLPAFLEKELVQIHQLVAPSHFHYGNNFLHWRQLMATPQPADPAQVNPDIPFGLGWPQFFLALLGWWRRKRPLPARARAHQILLTVAALGLLLMTLPLSRPIWDHVPLLPFVQFPWRFLGPASLIVAVLAGAAVAQMTGGRGLWLPLSLAAMIIFALGWLFPGPYTFKADPNPVAVIQFEAETGALGTTSAGDYLPIWVEELPAPTTLLPLYEGAAPGYVIPRLDVDSLPPSVSVIEARYSLTEAWITLAATEPYRARFHWYFFPGWQVKLDGHPLPVSPDRPHGLLAVDVPAGQHQLHLQFGNTPLRRAAWGLSLLSLVLLVAALRGVRGSVGAGEQGSGGARTVNSQQSTVNSQHANSQTPKLADSQTRNLATICLFIGLALFAIKTVYLDHTDNLFRQALFDGHQVGGVDVPLQVNFGQQMILLGYDLSPDPVPADGLFELALYWRTQPPVDVDYSIAVHVVDDLGRRYGQQDNYHPAGYPTTRWREEEYARDVHRLALLPGTPPGTYSLEVSVYEFHSGRRLEVLNDAGQPLGVSLTLAQVQVLRPARFPAAVTIPVTRRLEANLGDGVYLLGLDPPPVEVEAGHLLPFTLYWQAQGGSPAADYQVRLRLLTAAGQSVAQAQWTPGREGHPTSAWLPGEIIRDDRAFLAPATKPGSANEPLSDGRYFLRLELVDSAGRTPAGNVDLGEVAVHSPSRSFAAPTFSYSVVSNFAGLMTLLGYDLTESALRPGDSVSLTLYWQVDAPIDVAYTIFVHLVGPDERIYAQQDQTPVSGTRPTTGWLPGEFLQDAYTLAAPAHAPAGRYTVRVGLYDPATGDRVPVRGLDGAAGSDHVILPAAMDLEKEQR